MRKIIYTLSVFIFAVFMIICFPSSSKADGSLSIPNWIVEVILLETGDLSIVEDITFEFNNELNGVFREIVLDKTSGVENITVKEITGNTDTVYTQVGDAEKVSFANRRI